MSRARDLADSADKDIAGTLTLDDLTVSGTVTGNVTGDLTGDVTGNLTGDTIGTHTGAVNATNITVTGVVTGNVTGDILGDVKADNGTVILDSGTNGRNAEFTGDVDISAIAATIADTAVDIFVYDTRKDSDGGAWRKRTQHTSWYNETLNTSTRGSRKEFPAVAVIVAESNQVTIYDGDDPDLPMWMVFDCADGNDMLRGIATNAITSIAMLNGMLSVCGQSAGFIRVNYLSEYSDMVDNSRQLVYLGNVSDRNSASGFSANTGNSSSYIVSYFVNDVAMTVLPNAPIDAATGLPVPTIAVATNGGVSVIKDDGTVVDITTTNSSYNRVPNLSFRDDGKMSHVWSYTGNAVSARYVTVTGIPSADYSIGDSQSYSSAKDEFYADELIASRQLTITIDRALAQIKHSNHGKAFGQSHGVALLEPVQSAPETGLVANVTSSYNTGWMHGDIKLATLSDTDATNVTGSELVTNGDFAGNLNNWDNNSSGTGSVVYDSGTGAAKFTRVDGNNNGLLAQGMSLVSGQKYVLSFDVATGTTTNVQIRGYISSTNTTGTVIENSFAVSAGNSYAITFVAPSGEDGLEFRGITGTNTVLYLDNISVRLAEEDRSVNGNGLQVFGTVQKEAVATGADLVQYNGFNSSNYLEQPYNSDLDFGSSDDFCVMGWFKATSTTQILMSKSPASSIVSPYFEIQVDPTNVAWVGNNTTGRMVTPSAIGPWSFVAVSRINGTNRLFLNGELKATASSTEDYTHSNTDTLRFGQRQDGYGGGYPAGLALWRISATAPSLEQIKKIYEDEKFLFQENAQATLYGSSDAVTALAYDDSTNILSVGTSAGRSDFQGLRRVNNTTNAVGAAISASNGLIVEE